MDFLRKARSAALIEKRIIEMKRDKVERKAELRKELESKLQDIKEAELEDPNLWMNDF